MLNLSLGTGRAGSGIFAVALARKLVQLGHQVIQGCAPGSFTEIQAEEAALPCYRVTLTSLYEFRKAKQLARYCREEKIDVINAHHSGERYLAIFSRLLFRCPARIILTRHAVSGTVPFFGSLIYNLGADMNIAVSRIVMQSLKRDLTFRKILIYGGIDIEKVSGQNPERIAAVTREIRERSHGIPVVGMVADYDPGGKNRRGHGKGHAVLFEAVSILKRPVFLLLVGPLPDHCESLLSLADSFGIPREQIMVVPFQKEIAPYYYAMNMHVLPSYSESLGLVNLEAMAAGVPCIGSDIGGINEVISDGRNGLLFARGIAGELADRIRLLLDDAGLRKRLSETGKSDVKIRFDIARTAKETADLCYRVVGDRH
jgi:glycosyltransferase involved in cell wall biosynthesis